MKRKMNKPQKNYWDNKAYIKKDQCDLINLYCERNGYSYPDIARAMDMNCRILKGFLIGCNRVMKCKWSTYEKIGGFIADKRLYQRRVDYLAGDELAMTDIASNIGKYNVYDGAVTSVEEVQRYVDGINKDVEKHGYCYLDFNRVIELKRFCEHFRISRNELTYELRLSYPTIKRFWDGEMRVSYATYKAVTNYMDEHNIHAPNDDLLE